VRRRERVPPWQNVALTGWAGMYGAVSLAAALSVPSTLSGGPVFPGRDLILFLTFSVILVTLVFKGMSLPVLVRALGAGGDDGEVHEEKIARFKAIAAAEMRLEEIEGAEWAHERHIAYMRGYYTKRRKVIETTFGVRRDEETHRYTLAEEQVVADQRERQASMRRLKLELIAAERIEVVRLRNQGAISDGVMHRLERDLDLEDLRLAEAPA
jgi:CPA1 family monovalent cation:H+ antiporter